MKLRTRPTTSADGTGGHADPSALQADDSVASDDELAMSLARQHGLPQVDFGSVTPAQDALDVLDEATARACVALPYAITDSGAVAVAIADPTAATVARLREAIGRPLSLAVA